MAAEKFFSSIRLKIVMPKFFNHYDWLCDSKSKLIHYFLIRPSYKYHFVKKGCRKTTCLICTKMPFLKYNFLSKRQPHDMTSIIFFRHFLIFLGYEWIQSRPSLPPPCISKLPIYTYLINKRMIKVNSLNSSREFI